MSARKFTLRTGLVLATASCLAAINLARGAEAARGAMPEPGDTYRGDTTANTEFNVPTGKDGAGSDVVRRSFETRRAAEAPPPAAAPVVPVAPAVRNEIVNQTSAIGYFASGLDDLQPPSRALLDALAEQLKGKRRISVVATGHADTQRPSARTRARYGDNLGLAKARASQVAQYLGGLLQLSPEAFTVRSESDLKPMADNATPEGMARNRRVELAIAFEQEVPVEMPAPAQVANPQPPIAIAPTPVVVDRSQCSAGADGVLPLRITVDGQPQTAADPVSEADHQRCVDVATNRHDIQVQFDPLMAEPALNAGAWPEGVAAGQPVQFSTYSNYTHWIQRAELRFFVAGQDERELPFKVLPVQVGAETAFTPETGFPAESFYVLRVYDAQGRFDETVRKHLSVLDQPSTVADVATAQRERLTSYGTSTLRIRNIPVAGGSVTVSGRNVEAGEIITVQGATVPVDSNGRFAIRQLLPAGDHTLEVATAGPGESQTRYVRNLTLRKSTWFHVVLGELTVADNHTTGPAELVTQDSARYGKSTEVTGRGAFYAKGRFGDDYRLTMSADTRERPLEDLFSNFTSKDPRYLLERIDAERAYPVYGDDSTSEWDAPTYGRFYARLERHDSRAIWGNFQTTWTGLELNQFSRGLYGAEGLYKSQASTTFGERRVTAEGFAAEPGTLSSREEFRGTGGSLYYLRRQDITRGSERLWVEIRDATSSIALQRIQLVPGIDYDLSYLQGRVLLRAPLSSVADSGTLVQAGALSGNPAYLVTTYEYTPGLNTVNSNVYGLRGSGWLNDHVRIGVSGYRQGESTDRQTIGGVDATLRYKAGTYLDAENARSDGAAIDLSSIDGGFNFGQRASADARAWGWRLQGALDLADLREGLRGRGSVYFQERQAGFSGPGVLTASQSVQQQGVAFSVPLGERTSVDIKADERDSGVQIQQAEELALHRQMDERWSVSLGGRHDKRENGLGSATSSAGSGVSSLLAQNGSRTDLIARLDFRPAATDGKAVAAAIAQSNAFDVTRSTVPSDAASAVASRAVRWNAYGFVQGTVERSGDRDDNDRIGLGAARQLNDRFRLSGEVSDGSGGVGGRADGDYRINERANVYVSHTVETERQDANYRGRYDNTTLGGRLKLSDQVSVYNEARASRGAGPDSLINAFGLDLAPNDRWTYGLKLEAGTVSDPLAGDLKRRAAGLGVAYRISAAQFASNVEYRDESGTAGNRDTWLMRNSGKLQVTPAWRLLGKLNFSFSDASQGNFYDGNFVDTSIGAAYRPVDNNRWNTLFQYRYYYSLPSPGQVNLADTTLDYAQRSHVLSADAIHEVTPWLSVGAKFGLRVGSLKDTRVGGDWYSSRTDLVILRADLHIVREWDAMIEGRRLNVHDADTVRSGFLAGVYRQFGSNAKVGVGYNFTDFSDDLTDLSFRSRGLFLNIVATH